MGLDRDLYAEMLGDRIVIDLLADRAIAVEFYAALCNMQWRPKASDIPEDELIIKKLKGEEEILWSCTWRSAGGYIAGIRIMFHGKTEDYMDFYCSGNEGVVSDLVRECFDRMGWEPVSYKNV